MMSLSLIQAVLIVTQTFTDFFQIQFKGEFWYPNKHISLLSDRPKRSVSCKLRFIVVKLQATIEKNTTREVDRSNFEQWALHLNTTKLDD